MATQIVFKSTKLGIWYPTINGVDVYRELSRKHGCSYLNADHPVFENMREAEKWATDRGYLAAFEKISIFDCRRPIESY